METFTKQLDTGTSHQIEIVACSAGFATTVPVNTTHESGTLLSLCEVEPYDMVLVKLVTDLGEADNPADKFYIFVATDLKGALVSLEHCELETSWTFHQQTGQITIQEGIIEPGQWGYFEALSSNWGYGQWLGMMIRAADMRGLINPAGNAKSINQVSLIALKMGQLQKLTNGVDSTIATLLCLIQKDPCAALWPLIKNGGMTQGYGIRAAHAITHALKALNPGIELPPTRYIQLDPRNS